MISKGFGRGIQTLLGDNSKSSESDSVSVNIDNILPNPYQPRKTFNDDEIKELSESIKLNGILQPLLVRKQGSTYELIAGERRLRSAKLSSLSEVPCRILDIPDEKMLELSIIENIQREDLNPIDEAESYVRLTTQFSRTHDDIARIVSKSRAHITNLLRLLGLPAEVKDMIRDGKLTMGHARSLLGLTDPAEIISLALQIVSQQISVRGIEGIVATKVSRKRKTADAKSPDQPKSPNLIQLEEEIMKILGTGIRIVRGKNKGTIEIDYYSDDDLDRIVALLRTL